jgi:hypothetical protein
MEHHLSPTGVAALLLIGVLVDYLSFLPNWLRDRIAFTAYTAGIFEGFNGSQLDAWTLDRLTGFIRWALDQPIFTGAYIAGASAGGIIGLLVFGVWVYALGCFLPVKAGKRLGRFATLTYPPSGMRAVNGRMMAVAAALGLFGDVPPAWIGDLTSGTNALLAQAYAPVLVLLLGGR